MRRTTWIAVLGLCLSTHCLADFLSGNDLLSRLRDYKNPRSNDIVAASAGYGYLLGISDAMNRTVSLPTILSLPSVPPLSSIWP